MAVPSRENGRDNLAPNECARDLRKLPNIINTIYNDIDHVSIDAEDPKLIVQEDDGSPYVTKVSRIIVKHGVVEDLSGNTVRITPQQPMMIVKTPGGGIAATTSNTSMSSATCTEWYQDSSNALTESTNTETIYNVDDTAVPGSAWGIAWYNFTDELWYTNSCCWNTTMTTVGSVTDPDAPPPTPGATCTTDYCNSATAPFQYDLTLANITTRDKAKNYYKHSRCLNEWTGGYSIFGFPEVEVWWDQFCEDVFNNTFRLTAAGAWEAGGVSGGNFDLNRLLTYMFDSTILNFTPGGYHTATFCRWESFTDLGLDDCCNDVQCDQPRVQMIVGYVGSDPTLNLPELNGDGTRNWMEGAFFIASLSSYSSDPTGGFFGGLALDQLEHIWGYKSISLPANCTTLSVTSETAYTELTFEDYYNGGSPLGKTWFRNCQAEEPSQNQTGTGATWALAAVT